MPISVWATRWRRSCAQLPQKMRPFSQSPRGWCIPRFLDTWREQIVSIRRIRGAIRKSLNGVAAIRSAASIRSVHGSHHVPSRDARFLETVSLGLVDLRASSHAEGATFSDAVLAAIAGSLRRLMEQRGESLNDVVISVPVSTRRAAVGSELGNHRGVPPLVIPTGGDRTNRLAVVGAITWPQNVPPRGLDRGSRSAISRFGSSRRLSPVRRPSTDDQRHSELRARSGGSDLNAGPHGDPHRAPRIPTGNLSVNFDALT